MPDREFAQTSHPQIVITGAAMATCLGLDRETIWTAVRAGQCGMVPLTALEQPLPEGRLGGQAPELPTDQDEPGKPREVRYLRKVLRDAFAEAGIAPGALPYPAHRCGLMIGTTLHGMRAGGEFLRSGDHEPLRSFLASSMLRASAFDLGVSGFAATTCSACSSSLGSIALGVSLLQSGELDLVIAGGYDPISEYVYAGFNSLRLVAEGPLRPFARGREGMKLAEGYAIVILERADDAAKRGAPQTIARILGCGESADAHHLTQPHPQGDGAARAISAALAAADILPDDIDLIAAHATGTPDNDAGEFAAISRVFGERLPAIPVVGFKSHMGHTLGGAGAVELILSAMALRDGVVPPCANSKAEDVEYAGLSLSVTEKTASLRAALNTSLGFGGANTCVIIGRDRSPSPLYSGERAGVRGSRPAVIDRAMPSDVETTFPSNSSTHPATPKPLTPALSPEYRGEGVRTSARDVFITGIGVVLPGAIGVDAFAARLNDPNAPRVTVDTGSIPESEYLHLLNARRVRRMSDYVKLSLAATALAFTDAHIAPDQIAPFAATCGAILGSTHGSANYSRDYYKQVVDEGIFAANPMLFAEGVPNAAAAHLSLMMSLKGACQTIIGTRTAGLDALRLAAMRIRMGDWERAVVSAGEEFSPIVAGAYGHCGLYAGKDAAYPFTRGDGFALGCGAVTLILESGDSMRSRANSRARGIAQSFASAAPGEGDEIRSTARVLRELGDTRVVLSSANGSWIDRVESAGLRASRRAASVGETTIVSSLYGHTAELFSAGPLAGIAAVLLTGKLPRLFGSGNEFGDAIAGAAVNEPADSVSVLCTDYTGLVSGARIARV